MLHGGLLPRREDDEGHEGEDAVAGDEPPRDLTAARLALESRLRTAQQRVATLEDEASVGARAGAGDVSESGGRRAGWGARSPR